MSKRTKIWLVIAAVLVLIGGILFAGVMTALNWDFNKLSTVTYVDNNHVIREEYTNISIAASTANIEFVPSEEGETSVVCHEQEKLRHTVEVKDGTLHIAVQDTRKWYEYMIFGFDTPKITVTLPRGEYGSLFVKTSTGKVTVPKGCSFTGVDISATTGAVAISASVTGDVKLKTSTGSIRVENATVGALELLVSTGKVTVESVLCHGPMAVKVSTGKTELTDVRCRSLESNGSTGDISLKAVTVTETLSIKRSTGSVRLEGSDAAELYIRTDTGDVRGALLTDKIFVARSDTGRVDVPKTVTGGRCEITTGTGDIQITIQS